MDLKGATSRFGVVEVVDRWWAPPCWRRVRPAGRAGADLLVVGYPAGRGAARKRQHALRPQWSRVRLATGGWSGGAVVLVDESAEQVPAHDPPGDSVWLDVVAQWWGQLEAAVRPDGVVVQNVHREDPLEATRTGDECPVQALGPDGAHPAFGVGIRPWRPRWDLQYPAPAAVNTASNAAVNFVSRSRTRNRTRSAFPPRSSRRFRAA